MGIGPGARGVCGCRLRRQANDKRSVSGIAVTLGGTVVSHASKTQHAVSLPTSEAEYITAEDGVKEALFVRAVLFSIAPETSGASIKVLEDKQGAKVLIENPCALLGASTSTCVSTPSVIYSGHGKSA